MTRDLALVKTSIVTRASGPSWRRDLNMSLDCAGNRRIRTARTGGTPGNAQLIQALLATGADPNAALHGGETALMTAARTGRVEAVQALLDAGAKLNAKDRKGQTALMWAAADGHAAVIELLIHSGAD